MDTSFQSLDQIRASALDMAVRFGPKLVVAILIMGAGYMVGRWLGGVLERLLVRLNLEPPVRSLLVRIAQVCVLAIFAIMALQNLGICFRMPLTELSLWKARRALRMSLYKWFFSEGKCLMKVSFANPSLIPSSS